MNIYGVDNRKRCQLLFLLSGSMMHLPALRTQRSCQHEVHQLQAQVLDSLVEAGMFLHKPLECSHPALQLNRWEEGVDSHCREHDLLSRVKS